MRRCAAVAAVLAVLLASCSNGHKPALPPRHQLSGEYAVHGVYPHRSEGMPCKAKDVGYPDIRPDTPVTVRDGTGALLGRTTLGNGTLRRTILIRDDCVHRFSLTVPDRGAYEIEVGTRGSLAFSRADLERNQWEVSLGIGNLTMGI